MSNNKNDDLMEFHFEPELNKDNEEELGQEEDELQLGSEQIKEVKNSREWNVKVYKVNSKGDWDDNGTGYIYIKGPSKNQECPTLNIKIDNKSEVDQIIILPQMKFNNQRGSIITWKTSDIFEEDDVAISFTNAEGYKEIWELLCKYTGRDPKIDFSVEESPQKDFPEVNKDNLKSFLNFIVQDDGEKIFELREHIRENNYQFIKELGRLLVEEEKERESLVTKASETSSILKIMNDTGNAKDNPNSTPTFNDNNKNNDTANKNQISENKDSCANLKTIYNIFKNMIMLGDKDIIEMLLNDDLYLITFGALEYDSDTNGNLEKLLKHRDFFIKQSKFNNCLDITDEKILSEIRLNHRLLYLRDTAMSRVLDESTVKAINMILQFHYNDIVQFFLSDQTLFITAFNKMTGKNEDEEIKFDLIEQKNACLVILELMNCTKDLYSCKTQFYETLIDCGIINAIQRLLSQLPIGDNYKNHQKLLDKIEEKNKISDSNGKAKNNIDILKIDEYINFNKIEIKLEDDRDEKVETEKKIKCVIKDESDMQNIEIIQASLIEMIINILNTNSMSLRDYILENNKNILKDLINLMLCHENFGIKYEISMIVRNLFESEYSCVYNGNNNKKYDIFIEEVSHILIEYLKESIPKEHKQNDINNKQLVFEILIQCIVVANAKVINWLSTNSVNEYVFPLLNLKNAIIQLHCIKFYNAIININSTEIYYINTTLNKEWSEKIINIFNKNKRKDNLIISAICDLLCNLLEKYPKIFENLVKDNKDFFYDKKNQKFFSILLQKFENPEKNNQMYGKGSLLSRGLSSQINDLNGFLEGVNDDGELDEFHPTLYNHDFDDKGGHNFLENREENMNDDNSEDFDKKESNKEDNIDELHCEGVDTFLKETYENKNNNQSNLGNKRERNREDSPENSPEQSPKDSPEDLDFNDFFTPKNGCYGKDECDSDSLSPEKENRGKNTIDKKETIKDNKNNGVNNASKSKKKNKSYNDKDEDIKEIKISEDVSLKESEKENDKKSQIKDKIQSNDKINLDDIE